MRDHILTEKFAPLVEAFRDAIEAITETGDVRDEVPLEDQLVFLLLRHRLIDEGLRGPAVEVSSRDQSASGALERYLEQLGRTEDVLKTRERVAALVEKLLDRSVQPVAKGRISDISYEVLQEAGEPLHFSEIAKRVTERNGRLGGRDPALTLRAYLHRDKRFIRDTSQRGYYMISEK